MKTRLVLKLMCVSLGMLVVSEPDLTARAATVSSTFDSTAESWTAAGDFATPVTWQATGGNPGGTVSIEDSVTGGVTFFVAPAKYLGNHSDAFGKTLTFDLKQIIGSPNQFEDDDVFLTGNGTTLSYDTPYNPALDGSWTSYSIPLTATGWHVNTIAGVAATQSQMQSVLAALTDFRIRAEYQSGADTDYLDNVRMNGITAGDFNVDNHVNAADIIPAQKALTDLAGYQSQYGVTTAMLPLVDDVNGDGKFSGADLQKLLINLKNGGGSFENVPEPAAVVLLMLGAGGIFMRRWKCPNR